MKNLLKKCNTRRKKIIAILLAIVVIMAISAVICTFYDSKQPEIEEIYCPGPTFSLADVPYYKQLAKERAKEKVKQRFQRQFIPQSKQVTAVYWVPDGEVYHISKNCPTLNHSKIIEEGETPPSDRRICKVCLRSAMEDNGAS